MWYPYISSFLYIKPNLDNLSLHYGRNENSDYTDKRYFEVAYGELGKFLSQTGLKISVPLFISITLITGLLSLVFSYPVISSEFCLLSFLIGASFPYLYLERKVQERAIIFSQEYATILMAMSSSVKAGMTPIQALARSSDLLNHDGVAKNEIKEIVDKLESNLSLEESIKNFGNTVRLPEIELFKTSIILAMENGGQYSITLQRLSRTVRDRAELMQTAKVSTSSMRLTGNAILLIGPFLLVLMSLRDEMYWQTFLYNNLANQMASIGIVIICINYIILKLMSNFRP